MSNRCWAFGPDMRRCDLMGGHEGKHEVTTAWNDEESLTFEGFQAVVEATPIHTNTHIDHALIGVQTLDSCVACGCTGSAHDDVGPDGEAMCVKHQCRTFIPT